MLKIPGHGKELLTYDDDKTWLLFSATCNEKFHYCVVFIKNTQVDNDGQTKIDYFLFF